jgi:protein O-GlcNAc transferase
MATPQRTSDAPGGPTTLEARALALVGNRDFAAARPLLRRAIASSRRCPELRSALAKAHFELGDVRAAVRELARLSRSRNPRVRRLALGMIAVYIPGHPGADNAQVLTARRRWARQEARLASLPRRPPRLWPLRRRLRIGYVSAYFDCRNWMKPVWRTLAAHDRRAFEVHLFIEDGLPARAHGYVPNRKDRVHLLDGLTNEKAAARIAAARLDVLVDLNAFSLPRRLGLFLRRPAPVQIGWFNTFATSGMEAFDYAIADAAVLPPSERRYYSERIRYIDGSYLAFRVPYRVPRVRPPPLARFKRFTFGCFAPQYKITPEVIRTFAAILRAAPKARLLLKNTCLAQGANCAAVRNRFLRLGVGEDQLMLEGPAGHYAFLKAYDRIDVALDTFPYSGGVTTMEALWQGVPVLTLVGDRWASRTSGSLLRAAGLGEWICSSRQTFIRRAIGLAGTRKEDAGLAALRANLRARLLKSPACDVAGLCRQLEAHYRAAVAARSVVRRRIPVRR